MLRIGRESRSDSTDSTVARLPRPRGRKQKTTSHYQPIDSDTKTILYGICSRLGVLMDDPNGRTLHQKTYVLAVGFGEALEDLVTLLESDEGPILVQLGEMQVVTRHLVPMLCVMERGKWEGPLFALLGILILLTNTELETNKASSELLLDYQRQSKKIFETRGPWEALLNLMISCATPRSETAQSDYEFLKKGLTLTRNVLQIIDAPVAYAATNVALASTFGKHERVIKAMCECRLIEFFILMAGNCNDSRDGRVFGPHSALLIEIFQYMFCAIDPVSVVEFLIEKDDADYPKKSETEMVLQKEPRIKKPIRHSRFSGAFTVRLSVQLIRTHHMK